jgi:hypothetical protein
MMHEFFLIKKIHFYSIESIFNINYVFEVFFFQFETKLD